MLTKTAVAGLAASALLASVAFAQSPSATTDRATTAAPAAASDTSSFKGNWRSSKLVGLNVYNDSNESLGSINDLLTDKSRVARWVAVETLAAMKSVEDAPKIASVKGGGDKLIGYWGDRGGKPDPTLGQRAKDLATELGKPSK